VVEANATQTYCRLFFLSRFGDQYNGLLLVQDGTSPCGVGTAQADVYTTSQVLPGKIGWLAHIQHLRSGVQTPHRFIEPERSESTL
jgi:hypothetical protein